MIAILSAIVGFLSSAFPEVLKYFQDGRDKRHELDILDKQIEMQKQGFNQRIEEVNASADIEEAKTLYSTYTTGIHWVDTLNGTVRPVLAYAFFLLYAGIKFMVVAFMVKNGIPFIGPDAELPWLFRINSMVWSEEDMAIFVGIISFYFGSRAMKRLK